MTSHNPDPFFFLPFRKGDAKETDWNVLLKYVKVNFPTNFNSNIQGAVDRLLQYKRVIAVTCTNDHKQPPNEAFIDQTLKQYIQLVATAQAHLPLYGESIKGLNFEWRDSIDDGYKHQSKNSNVEVFSCIHNLAVSYAYTACIDADSGTVEGVKNAFKTFQLAAGCFQAASVFLKRLPAACLTRDATPESQSVFQLFCMCQAHHCSYLKAELEMKGKHVLLSKMAAEGGRSYDDAAKTIASQGWKTNVAKDLESYCSNMSQIFFARGQLHLAAERMEVGEVGDAIARYNAATQSLQRIGKFPTVTLNQWASSIKATVNELHQKAVSANETVYFLRIPKDLPPLEGLGKPLGKPTPVTTLTKVISNRDADPFFGIVPAHIAEVAGKHFASMQELTSAASKQVAAYRARARTSLNNMGVTATIECLSSESKDQGHIPEPLRSKVLSLRPPAGGQLIETLVNRVTQAEEVRDAALSKHEDIRNLLMREQQEDEGYATQYGATLWRGYRPPSALTPGAQDVHKMLLKQDEQTAKYLTEPLHAVKLTLSGSLKELARLDWPLDDLDALMPFTQTKAVRQQTKAVMENVDKLRKFVARFDQVDEQNNAKLNELNALSQTDCVVHALSAVDADQHEAILDAASNEVKDIVSCIQANVASGETLLSSVEEIMLVLASSRSEDPVAAEIQKVCNMIETAMDLYQRLSQDVSELSNCATQSLESLESILSSSQSFVLSRTLEAEDIKSNIEAQIAAKVKEMDSRKAADATIVESQQRQEQLRRELEDLERQRAQGQVHRPSHQAETAQVQQLLGQRTAEVDRGERMQQLLNQQRLAMGQGQQQFPTNAMPYTQPAYQQQPQQQQPAHQHHQPTYQQQQPTYQQQQQPYQHQPPQQQQQQQPQYQQYATAPPAQEPLYAGISTHGAQPAQYPGIPHQQPYYGQQATNAYGNVAPPPHAPPPFTYDSATPPAGPPPPPAYLAQLPHPSAYQYQP